MKAQYHPSKTRSALLFLAMIGFISAGITIRAEQPVLGWLGIISGSLGGVMFVIQLIPGSAFLEIDENAFRYRVYFKTYEVPWSKVSRFTSVTMRDGRTQRIGWFYSDSTASASHTRESNPGERIPDAFLPELYGQKPEDLVSDLRSHLKPRSVSRK